MYVSRVLQHYEHSVTRLSLCRRGVSEWRLGKYGWDDDMEMWGAGLMEPGAPQYTHAITHLTLTQQSNRVVHIHPVIETINLD